jgi:hypothetical protein
MTHWRLILHYAGDLDIWRQPQGSYVKPFWSYDYPGTMKWLKKDVWHKPYNGIFTGKGSGPVVGNHQVDEVYSVLIMNYGAHQGHRFNEPGFVRALLDAVAAAKFDRFIWKTTTKKGYFVTLDALYNDPDREYKYYRHDDLVCSQPQVTCFNTSWTKKINGQTLMWDGVHFRAPVYNLLNVELMRLLGPT